MTQRNQALLKRARELLEKVIIVQFKKAREDFVIGRLTKVSPGGELTIFCLYEEAVDRGHFHGTDSRLYINNVFSLHELDDQYQNWKTF